MAELPSVWAGSRRYIVVWLEQRFPVFPGVYKSPLQSACRKNLAWLWKDYISSSCEACGKWINFWLNCFWVWHSPFHSLPQLLSSFKYLCCHSVVNGCEMGLPNTILYLIRADLGYWNNLFFHAHTSSLPRS